MDEPADIAAQLAALRARYAAQLGSNLSEMAQLVQGLEQGNPRPTLEEAHARLHRLVGSGSTFGFPELSRRAQALDLQVAAWLDTDDTRLPADWESWQTELLSLHETLSQPVEAAPVPVLATPSHGNVRIVLIDDDFALGAEVSRGLSQFDYEVTHFPDFASARPSVLANPPDIMLANLMLPGESTFYGSAGAGKLFAELGHRIQTIYLSSSDDFAARIAAASAEGAAFLVKPIHIPTLADRIEAVLHDRQQEPYRVLIVDDDEALAEHHRLTLCAAGLLAEKVCRAKDALPAMERLHPDLVVLDLYMPECTGSALARAIRYDDEWQGLPIVYLSSESNLQRQTKALGSGADDFLTKPISDQRFVSSIVARAARARRISELMSKDSLTGLLKHSSIKERVAQEVARCRRYNEPMAVVMIDIDHFKRVNDTYGHPAGDRVIKTLGHLLRQRLRRQDSIGRYGGEEFVAVLPQCLAHDARRMLDGIRQHFLSVMFMHGAEKFSVTFSAGIASTADFADAADLLAHADRALYVAKAGGRNQVQIAAPPDPP